MQRIYTRQAPKAADIQPRRQLPQFYGLDQVGIEARLGDAL
jgi:hypothetical protein